MARLLAAWELGLGNGHVAALAPVARALSALGHESWLAARNVVTPRVLPDRPFARILPAPLWLGPGPATPTLGFGQVIADAGFADDDGLIEIVRAWLALFDLVQPAGLYGDHAPASLLAAHIAGLPAARLGSPFTCPPASRPMPSLMPWLSPPPAGADPANHHADRVIRSVCRHFGAAMLDDVTALLATATPFLTSWPELDSGPQRTDSLWYGPLTGLAATAPPDWPDAPGPRIFTYLPFDRPAAAPLAQILAQRRWPTLWVCATPPPFALPPTIVHEAEPVDIAHALGESTLCISRGSHALALDAIRAGRPQLLLPDTVESRGLALALESQGLGRLASAWDEPSLGALLDTMVAAPAQAPRHADYDPHAAAARLAHDLATALHLD